MRWYKYEKYPDHKFILMMNPAFHIFVHDFISTTISLPQEFLDLKLETDCYESPYPNSPPSSLTPPLIYMSLIEYLRNFYNIEKAIELWAPRGCSTWIDSKTQIFTKYISEPITEFDKEIVCVFPRGRTRAPQRNVPEYIWKELVDVLREEYIVVLGGTMDGSYLRDYKADNVINLIPEPNDDKLDKIINYLCSSKFSISSQSGLTHVSLLSFCPTYIIGHERIRHAVTENRLKTPCSFRYVPDYRMIDVDTIIQDLIVFMDTLQNSGFNNSVQSDESFDDTISKGVDSMNELLKDKIDDK